MHITTTLLARGGGRFILFLLLLLAWAVLLTAASQSSSMSGSSENSASEAEARRQSNRGVAFLEQFSFTDAVEVFERVVELTPNRLEGHVNLGISYFNQRDFESAFESLMRARDIDADNPYVHYNLGLIHKLQGETEQALDAFEKVRELDPTDSMTRYYLGTLFAALGRLEEAKASLELTLELQPNNESALFSLGNVLIRQGDRDKGREVLTAFRELKENFPGEGASAGLQYTELGKYAEAIESQPAPLQNVVDEGVRQSAIRFVEVSAELGLRLEPLSDLEPLPKTLSAEQYSLEWIARTLLPTLGSGLSFRDMNGDGRTDVIFVRGGAPVLFLNGGDSGFERAPASGLPTEGRFVGVVVGDIDNDKDADAYLTGLGANALYLNAGDGTFTLSEDATVAGSDEVSVSAALADMDHDGDLDIYVANYVAPRLEDERGEIRIPSELPGATNQLYRNNGNGSFDLVTDATKTGGGALRSLGSLFSDFDEDRDIDFLVINDGDPVQLFSNDRIGTFTELSRERGLDTSTRTRGVDSGDFNRDGVFDLVLTGTGSTLNLLLRGRSAGTFRPDVLSPGPMASGVPGGRYGVSFIDGDNDADLDLLLVTNGDGAVATYYENTGTRFERAQKLAATGNDWGEGRALALADIDADGDLDAAIGTTRGRLLVYRNEGGNRNRWLSVRARGLRSNLDGLGAKVEVKAGESSLRRELRSSTGYFSQNDLPAHFGLGDAERADYVRFLWPGGVKQIEMDVEGARVAEVEELNRKGTSCPILYAWDGSQIRFVTDFLGGSAIGNLLAPDLFNYPDTGETVKMEAFDLVPREGFFEMRWVNQLEEVIIYDKASLTVIDHPSDLEVFPNERLMPGPPYPEDRLYSVRDARPPTRATDHRGNDVTEAILAKDRRYPGDFEHLPFKGYAEQHSLTLDLGTLAEDQHYVLLLYGWVDYADSSSNLAAGQAGVRAVTPYLEVGDKDGNFRMGLEQMGFPAGLPKTMLVDLEGLVGPNTNRVRITTNMRLHWDEIRLAVVEPSAKLTKVELPASGARLAFRGYPRSMTPDGKAPNVYDYAQIDTTALWGTHEGFYTRYGDVRELVESVDDRYVITHHGDELTLRFDAAKLPPLPDGYRRSFMAVADGFGKDMDLNAARPHSVEPLPFHSMESYPYVEPGYPTDEIRTRYRNEYNTRYIGPQYRNPFTTLDYLAKQNGARTRSVR